jgi:hypothetical protein
MKKILNVVCWPYTKFKEWRAWKKRLAELRARDPFIYK